MSDDCKQLMDRLGKYMFEERGQVEVKVVDVINTMRRSKDD